MDYNNEYAHLEPLQAALLNQILGYMTITYSKTDMREHPSPPIQVTLNDEVHDFFFDELTYPYRVLYCDTNSARIEFEHPYAGAVNATVNFVDQNTYWISPDIMPSTREYFLRMP